MKKDYAQTLLVGDSYLSALAGLLLSKKRASLSYLKGQSFSLDPSFEGSLSHLEFNFIQSYGRRRAISSLRKIHRFVMQYSYTFYYDNTSVILGRDIILNLQELARKFEIFNTLDQNTINFLDEFLPQYFEEISGRLVGRKLEKIRLNDFKDLRGVYKTLLPLAQILDEKFIRCFCAHFENYIPKKLDLVLRFRILIDIISPYWVLNSKVFEEEILKDYKSIDIIHDQANGVTIKSEALEGLSLDKSKVHYYFENLIGVGQPHQDLNIKTLIHKDQIIAVDFIFESHELLYHPLTHFDFIMKSEWLGSSVQGLKIQKFSQKTIITGYVSLKALDRAEESFIEYLKKIVDTAIMRIGAEKLSKMVPYFINYYDSSFQESKRRSFACSLKKNKPIQYALWASQKSQLKNTHFLGQYNSTPLGKISLIKKIEQL